LNKKNKDENQMEFINSMVQIDQVEDKTKIKKKRKNVNNELDTYLFQISTANIIRYFNYGILLPVKYIGEENRTEVDIQNRYPDFLVLTKHKYIDSKDRQYLIEVVLSEDEVKDLIKTNNKNVFLYSKPIPISRVINIFYNEKNDINDTLKTIEAGVDSFIINEKKKIKDLENIDNFNYKIMRKQRIIMTK